MTIRTDEARVTRLLSEAVGRYSPAFGEAPVAEVFADALVAAGLEVDRQPVPGPAAARGRANLTVRLGPEPVALHLVGHMDTIELAHDAALGPRREGERLYGLGTADMKGGCAAMVEAVVAVAEARLPLRQGLRLSLVVGEEEYGDGVEALIDSGRVGGGLTVVGEPTGLVPCTRHNGYLEMELSGEGARAHAALPEIGANAVEATLAWVTRVLREVRSLPEAHGTAVTLRQVRGGTSVFVVPDRCDAEIDVHLPPGAGPEAVEDALAATRDEVAAAHPGCELTFERIFWSQGYEVAPEEQALAPLRAAFDQVGLSWDPGLFPSHSDASLLHRAGSPTVVCGPGALEVAHTPGEYIDLPELGAAARLYAALVERACG